MESRFDPAAQAALFDHDGTLVDSEAVHLDLWRTILAEEGCVLTPAQFKAHCVGIPTPTTARKLVELFGLACPPEGLAARKSEATAAWLKSRPFPLMPHAREAIELCADAGLRLAVVTGAGRDGIASTLEAYGLASTFAVIVTGADVPRSKPHPDCYLRAVDLLGIPAAHCVSFEDTDNGVRASLAAGIRCIGVRHAFTEAHRFDGVDALFDDIGDAARWLTAGCSPRPAWGNVNE